MKNVKKVYYQHFVSSNWKWKVETMHSFFLTILFFFFLVHCILFRYIEYQEGRMWLQFSLTWEENICMERKGCLPRAHSLVLCPNVCSNGVNLRNLSNQEIASFSIHSFCPFCLMSLPPNFEAQWFLWKQGCW